MQLSTLYIREGLFASALLKADTIPQNPDPTPAANAHNALVSSAHLFHVQATDKMKPADAYVHLKLFGLRWSAEDHVETTPIPDFKNCKGVDDFSTKLLSYLAGIAAIDSATHHITHHENMRLVFRSLSQTPLANQINMVWKHSLPLNEPTLASFLVIIGVLKGAGPIPIRTYTQGKNQQQHQQKGYACS